MYGNEIKRRDFYGQTELAVGVHSACHNNSLGLITFCKSKTKLCEGRMHDAPILIKVFLNSINDICVYAVM